MVPLVGCTNFQESPSQEESDSVESENDSEENDSEQNDSDPFDNDAEEDDSCDDDPRDDIENRGPKQAAGESITLEKEKDELEWEDEETEIGEIAHSLGLDYLREYTENELPYGVGHGRFTKNSERRIRVTTSYLIDGCILRNEPDVDFEELKNDVPEKVRVRITDGSEEYYKTDLNIYVRQVIDVYE